MLILGSVLIKAPQDLPLYSSLGRNVGYMEHLFTGVGCMLDKGLELSRRVKSRDGETGGGLEGGVLQESEPVIAMPRKKASLRWAGTDDPDEGSRLYMGSYLHNRCDGFYQKSLS